MKILFITGVFENDATGAARFAKLIYLKGGSDFTILSEDTKGGDRIIKVDKKPKFFQIKLWQFFRIRHYRDLLEEVQDEFDVFIFNNSILAHGFKSTKPCFTFVHDEKLMKVNRTFRFDYIRRQILRRIEKHVIKSGIHIISNSNHISQRIIECYGVDSKKISLLYQGISLENKQKIYNKEHSKDRIKILFVKNDYLIGGLPDLISALGMLEEKSFNLTIIGTSNRVNDYLVSHQNINYNILGFQSNDAVVKAMYNHDILCIPARFEPLGVAVMEGLAVGIPTITTGVGGLPEVTGNGAYVWECEPNNPLSISKQIEACLTQTELRLEKSKKGRHHVHAFFDFKKVVTRLKEILHA